MVTLFILGQIVANAVTKFGSGFEMKVKLRMMKCWLITLIMVFMVHEKKYFNLTEDGAEKSSQQFSYDFINPQNAQKQQWNSAKAGIQPKKNSHGLVQQYQTYKLSWL